MLGICLNGQDFEQEKGKAWAKGEGDRGVLAPWTRHQDSW
jgi:hypothetical protein